VAGANKQPNKKKQFTLSKAQKARATQKAAQRAVARRKKGRSRRK
jgi:hypothetical protein